MHSWSSVCKLQYVMPSTGDVTFRVVVAFAMSDAWEHSHCHMHEHILICPWCNPANWYCVQASLCLPVLVYQACGIAGWMYSRKTMWRSKELESTDDCWRHGGAVCSAKPICLLLDVSGYWWESQILRTCPRTSSSLWLISSWLLQIWMLDLVQL
jgi:hypothetical protein